MADEDTTPCLRCLLLFVPRNTFDTHTAVQIGLFYIIEIATLITRGLAPPCNTDTDEKWWAAIIIQLVANIYFLICIGRSCWSSSYLSSRKAVWVCLGALVGLWASDLVLAVTTDLRYLLQFGVDLCGYSALLWFWQTKHDHQRQNVSNLNQQAANNNNNNAQDAQAVQITWERIALYILHIVFSVLIIATALSQSIGCREKLNEVRLVQAQLEFFLLGYIFCIAVFE